MEESGLKILLVDDEPKFLESIGERVRLKGFEPLPAQSGEEALKIARKSHVYAAVVDLKMPDMDGLTVIAKLKEIRPGIKTVLLTGFGDDKAREAAQALDAAYFEKDEMGRFWSFLTGMGTKDFRVLLVDDEKKFLDTLSDRVRLKGFVPITAQSGEEAVQIAREQKIHAAVVDLKMPGMDGLVTITKLKEIQPGIKTVLLTGFGDDKVREAAQALDAAYFEKDEMGGFWSFLKKVRQSLENGMAAAGMATGGDLEDAAKWAKKDPEK